MLTYENRGSRSEFFIIDKKKKLGFKTFDNKYDAKYALETQSYLSKFNLAPEVYSRVKRRRHKNKITGWGFDTEIAKTIGCSGNVCNCENNECDTLYSKYSPKIDILVDAILEYGYEFCDTHLGNVGFIYRNRKKILVCIDTGPESIVGTDNDMCDCSYCGESHG
jgi:hypothetical protein